DRFEPIQVAALLARVFGHHRFHVDLLGGGLRTARRRGAGRRALLARGGLVLLLLARARGVGLLGVAAERMTQLLEDRAEDTHGDFSLWRGGTPDFPPFADSRMPDASYTLIGKGSWADPGRGRTPNRRR